MRVLVAARSIDPDRTSGGIGTCRLVRALTDAGHEVSCLTDDWSVPFAGRETSVSWLPRVRVFNVYERAGIDGSGTPREDCVLSGARRPLARAWQGLAARAWHCATGHDRRFWRAVGRWEWALEGTVRRIAPDVVLTRGTGLGFEPHVALARHDPGVPWIANYHDPYPLSLYPPPYARRSFPVSLWQQHWHARILARAGALTFPSERLRDWVLDRGHADKRSKSFVLPHVAGPLPRANGSPPLAIDKGFLLVHTGTLLRQRDPRAFLAAFARFLELDPRRERDACCVLVGPVDPSLAFDSEPVARELARRGNLLVVRDRVGHDAATTIARRATAVMVLEAAAPNSPFLPGKMADYVALDKPILVLSPVESAALDLLGRDWPLHADPSDEARMLLALEALWEAWRTRTMERYRPPPRARERVSPGHVVARFERAAAEARGA